jgi:hypothetical protein
MFHLFLGSFFNDLDVNHFPNQTRAKRSNPVGGQRQARFSCPADRRVSRGHVGIG